MRRTTCLISGVRSLGAAGLARPQGPTQPPEYGDAPMAKLILYVNLEVIHHGTEICLLRDLYLWNGGAMAYESQSGDVADRRRRHGGD
jgi:hypothetical protein